MSPFRGGWTAVAGVVFASAIFYLLLAAWWSAGLPGLR